VGHLLWLQRAAGNAATSAMLARSAKPDTLPDATRSRMGAAFGADLSDVRVHEDSPKATGGRLAVTEGSEIHFGSGSYAPGTDSGDRLLAHELAHVLQQRKGSPGGEVSRAATELDAERAADAAAAGGQAEVLLGAEPGTQQAYEATEHTDLGNVAGGDQITIVTETGVRLTYGEIVALSGDFYRSPEAIMRAPADELRKILDIMRVERKRFDDHGGTLTPADSAEINKMYEAATSTSQRAKHHDHSSLGHDHDEGEEHGDHDEDEDHDADEEADDEDEVFSGKKKIKKTKYGPMVGDEHIESTGEPQPGVKAGDKPSASGSFLDLADENSSHFSPENIRENFKPKHLMAMDIGREAWAKREGKSADDVKKAAASQEAKGGKPNAAAKAQGEGAEPGALPSARMSTTPTQQGAPQVGKDDEQALKDFKGGPNATPTHVRGAGGKAGEQEEARALMVSAFAAHFLTDAFAGGHLVSGVEARKYAPTWFSAHKAALTGKVATELKKENPKLPQAAANTAAGAMVSVIDTAGKVPGVLLKLVHDEFNKKGVRVKNARGTVWSTKGDASLRSSKETIKQAESATKAARDAVQDNIKEGKTDKPYEALDYVPDVGELPAGSGKWRPIEQVSKDKKIYEDVWDRKMIGDDTFYQLVKSYKDSVPGLIGSMVKLGVLKKVETVKSWGRKLKKKLGSAWDSAKKFIGSNWDKLKDWGKDKLDAMKSWGAEQWEKAKEIGGGVVDKAKDIGGGIADWFGGAFSKAKDIGGGIVDAVKDVGGKALDLAGRGASAVGGAVSSVAGKVGGAAKSIWGSIKSLGSSAIDKIKETGSVAGKWASNAWDVATKFGRDKVDQLTEGAENVWKKLSGGSKAIADKVVGLYNAAKKKAAGWVADRADDLTGGPGKEGTAPTETGRVSEVANQTYAHGGFMGAGGAFMHDPVWSGIFKALMPAEYEKVSKIAEPEKQMLALENNPVLAAYGSARHMKEIATKADLKPDADHKALPLEWDVWLPPDPKQLTDLSAVKIAHGNLGTTVGQGIAGDDPVGYARDDVKNAPSSGDWMRIFGTAMSMYRGVASGKPGGGEAEAKQRDAQLKKLREGTTGDDAIKIAKEFIGPNGGLILDVKSTYSKPEHVATFVKYLKAQGINVFGVGTFKPEQLAALDKDTRKVKFFHGINDLERASAGMHMGGKLEKGDDVMFNAGSLLSEGREYLVAGDKTYQVDQGAFQRLVAIQRSLSLNIGLYVQESAVSPDAVQKVTELVNKHPAVFTRGFAYGNISGEAEKMSEGTGMGAQKWMNW
jgi:hypothetical protein